MGYEGSVPASVGGLEGLPIGEPPAPRKREVDDDEGDCVRVDCDDEDSYSSPGTRAGWTSSAL